MILDVYSTQGVQADQGLSIRELHLLRYGWERHHRDNFAKAVVLMINSGLVAWGDGDDLLLTEAGYKALRQSEG